MAHIFYGRRDMLNPAVLEAVKTLSDDFWVLAEFDLDRRNIDWLILRAVPDDRPDGRFSTVYLTELKQTSAQFSGGENGQWSAERNGIAKEIVPNNKADENHWHQAINVANVVRGWLYINQRRYLSLDRPEQAEAAFKLWPTLLILSSPPELSHRLPLKPANRFGAFHFALDKWLDTLKNWEPKEGIQLTAGELERLVAAIGLQELPRPATPPHSLGESEPSTGSLEWLQGFTRWATGIDERLGRLEEQYHIQQSVERVVVSLAERLKRLEADLGTGTTPTRKVTQPDIAAAKPKKVSTKANDITPESKTLSKVVKNVAKPAQVTTKSEKDRALTDDERSCLLEALTAVRLAGKSRTIPSVVLEMDRIQGGESLKYRKYNGYGSAKAMFDRAKKEKLIRYGTVDGTNVLTIYSYNETVPKKAPVS